MMEEVEAKKGKKNGKKGGGKGGGCRQLLWGGKGRDTAAARVPKSAGARNDDETTTKRALHPYAYTRQTHTDCPHRAS
jgi:hypothetical protein